MRKITSGIVLLLSSVGWAYAHLSVDHIYPSSGGKFYPADIEVLPSGVILGSAYDSLSSGQVLMKTYPVGDWVAACVVRPPFTLAPAPTHLKVRDEAVLLSSPYGVMFTDTSLAGVVAVMMDWKADASIVGGDTVLMFWGPDSLYLTLGTVSSGGFSSLSNVMVGGPSHTSVGYALARLGRGRYLAAYADWAGTTLNLIFLSVSGPTLSVDSALSFGLPSGWDLHAPSVIRGLSLPSGGFALGFTVNTGAVPYPAVLLYDGSSYVSFRMDSSGVLSDLSLTSEGLMLSVGSTPGYAQVLPLDLSDGVPSVKGFVARTVPVDGGTEYAPGHYVAMGRDTVGSAINLIYTDFNTADTVVMEDTRSWLSFTLSPSTYPISPTPSTYLPSDTVLPCSPFTLYRNAVVPGDTAAPVLTSAPVDTVIKAYDTLAYGFSEEIDPLTFQSGVITEAYGTLKRPVPTSSFCVGTWCYLVINASGTDSVRVRLTAFITDTNGVPLAPASRISQTFSVLPVPVSIVFTQPDSGEINVPLNANVGVWFSGPIDTTTVNTYSVVVSDGTVSYPFTTSCPFPNMCVLDPVGDFPPSATITVSFTSAIHDIYDQPIYPKVVAFRTVEEDTLSPRVAMTVPDSGDIGVPRNFALSVLFSKPMDTTTVAGGVSLLGSSSGSHTFNVFCPTLKNCVVRPLSAFLSNEVVTVRFNSSIRDTTGRALIPRTVVFQVGSTYDNVPPNVQILAPPNDTLVLYHPITSPLKAAVWDNTGILMASWIVGSETHHAPLSCRGLPYVASDTTCVDVSELPSDTFVVKAIAYDLANTQSVDSVVLIVHDTVRPRVAFTEPANGDMAVSPYTDVNITFTEPMDTTVFSGSYVSVVVGTSPVSYTHRWNTPYTLRLSFSDALPWDSTVMVSLDSLRDLSGNLMVPYSITFKVVGETHVNVSWVEMKPETVFVGNRDSVEVVAVATSDHTVRRAVLLVGDRDSVEMRPVDGSFDEPVETVSVWLRTENLPAGEYPLRVRAHNPYVFGLSSPRKLNVLDVPLLSPENVYVYPSPVKDHGRIRVVVGEPTTLTVEVFDLKYRRVLYESKTFGSATVYEKDLPKLPVGVYLLRVRAGDMTVNKWFAVVGRR